MVAEVLVEIKALGEDKTFTYNIPDNLLDKVNIGIRVLVPFSKQKLEGFVLNINKKTKLDYELKDIIDIIDLKPVLNNEMLELGKYISKKTLCNLITAYQTMLPSALKAKNGFNVNKKYVTYLKLNDLNYIPKNEKQKQILDLFKENTEILKKEVTNISPSITKNLIEKQVLIELKKETYRLNNNYQIINNKPIKTKDQQNAFDTINKNLNNFKSYLLHGVTGSGKTEVYMSLIEEVLKQNKEIIVLVPEISLTPQLINTLRNRFGNLIAILHSRLNDGEKYDEWRKIEEKNVKIVVGARSAIFAPFTNLGLIIIDEEHSETYKQENNPRYHAIDIALFRAKKYNCPLILGSATPSIESYTRAKLGVYELVEMPNRVNNNMPKVTLIDMKDEMKKNNRYFSETLKNYINDRLNKNEQIILLLNRRGFHTVITCHNCGYVENCPYCDIPLTYHKTSNTMRCHYCGYGNKILTKCPKCNSKDINGFGMGTEKLVSEINKEFETAKVIRMDQDTTTKKGAHEKIINDFKEKKYDILVGTQMIAKGLDFENVTLVGVINGDASLNIPDFRSAERTFSLLNQVSGRAGRSKLIGEVVIQGFNINHYSIVKASLNDYKGFYNEELNIRKKLGYPPYFNLCLLKLKSKDLDLLKQESEKISKYLKTKLNDVTILGPSMSSMPKINNIYNMQIIIKYKKTNNILDNLTFINNQYKKNNKIKLEIDINPLRI